MHGGSPTGAALPIDTRFNAQRAFARAQAEVPWAVRRDRLLRLRRLVQESEAAIAAAIALDFGRRAREETQVLEVLPSLEGIRHALVSGKRWMRPRQRRTSRWFLPGRAELRPQPLGVVGVVVPWNYPLYLTVGPLTAALAAGNRAMVKLSELTPQFGAWFADVVTRHFASDEVTVVTGGVDVGRAFCALPFDHLLFTGSSSVAHEVLRSASHNLTPVTLELGGKSPVVIGPDADIEHAAARIMSGKLRNAGQTCVAPDYVLVPEGRLEAFLTAARRFVRAHYPALTGPAPAGLTSIISTHHYQRLAALVADALARGARAVSASGGEHDPGERLFQPTLITEAPADAQVLREEIFGPILPLVSYRRLEEAVAYINARPRPLATYVFTRDRATADCVLATTVAGGATVNDTLVHLVQDDLPFGGIGPSGMGVYHGQAGFDTFSHLKPVFWQSRWNAMSWFEPPYGARFGRLVKLLLQ